jgi:hypothetical protein
LCKLVALYIDEAALQAPISVPCSYGLFWTLNQIRVPMQASTEYIKIASHEAKKGEFQKCLLLYSGGLDTSVMLKWIQGISGTLPFSYPSEAYECEVYALTIDIGTTRSVDSPDQPPRSNF